MTTTELLNAARELLREIRDNEVNAQDEADKFLRDGVCSELSKSRNYIEELEGRSIHSCGDHCQRPACVKRHERETMIAEQTAQIMALCDALTKLLEDTVKHQCGDGSRFFSVSQRMARAAISDLADFHVKHPHLTK